ncbi:MAG: DUF1080 domain-containing protein [Acidobacteria bacterium]|nr:DUF1080 domain-containing protein [Acidobacteriota bacterium]
MRTLIVCTLLAVASTAVAAPPKLTPEEKAAGWMWLFDGSDTSAWMGMDRTPFPSRTWVVEDGTLRTTEDGSGGDLRTIDEFQNFELAFDWKIAEGGNSGVKYIVQPEWVSASFRPDLSAERKQRIRLQAVGLEYQMMDDAILDHSKPDWELSATGAVYLLAAPPHKNAHPPGEWNSARIVVRGDTAEHWLNGEKILTVQLGSKELLAQVEKTKFRKMSGYGRPGSGPIVLQHHGKPAWFRAIKVRRLAD